MADSAKQEKLIVGLGMTGLSCARFLSSQSVPFRVADSRSSPPGLAQFKQNHPEVAVELGPFDARSFQSAAELLVSPGVSLREPAIAAARAQGVPVSGDIDLFSRHARAPIVAVTGSNGKSTVVEILAAILNRAGYRFGLGGNLDGQHARPALDLLLEPESPQCYLLELSSFQLETTAALGAEVACILNISADHLDRHDNFQDYVRAKQRIFRGASKMVFNHNDEQTWPAAGLTASRWDFGADRPGTNGFGLLEDNGKQYLAFQQEKLMPVDQLKVFGQHNIANILAAAALASCLGIPRQPVVRAVSEFAGLPHRCQWVAEVGGVAFYNDSKGTNVGATLAAVEGLGQRIEGHIVLIAGGIGKGANFHSLVPAMSRWGKEVVLIGQDATEMAASFATSVATSLAGNMEEAVRVAHAHAAPGDAVLLSPACASFDMFENFQHRGQRFIESVGHLQ